MLPIVIVHFDAETPEPAAVIQACSSALIESECVASDEVPDKEREVLALAVVLVDGERAVVQVGTEGKRSTWHEQTIDFRPGDPSLERARVLGFSIASLLDEHRRKSEAMRQEAQPGTANVSEPLAPAVAKVLGPVPVAEPPQPAELSLLLGGGLILGPGLSVPETRWGGRLGAQLHFRPFPIGVGGAFDVTELSLGQALRATFYDFDLGVHYRWPEWRRHRIDVSAGFHGSFQSAHASLAGRGETLTAFAPGAYLGLTYTYRLGDQLGLGVWTQGVRSDTGTQVIVREVSEEVARADISAYRWMLGLVVTSEWNFRL